MTNQNDQNEILSPERRAQEWLKRCEGSWRSERRYFYSLKGRPDNITTLFTITEEDEKWTVKWTGRTSGEMRVYPEGNLLRRDRNYFGNDSNDSQFEMIDDDTMVLHTSYDGYTFREEIRLLDNDKYRLRQTLGLREEGFGLVGQYFEVREG